MKQNSGLIAKILPPEKFSLRNIVAIRGKNSFRKIPMLFSLINFPLILTAGKLCDDRGNQGERTIYK